MSIIQAIILGLVQGLTEFIPVSSSGHLIILHNLMGISENGLTFDVALHFGTLFALIIFFYRDILELIKAVINRTKQARLAWLLAAATVPAVVVGVLLESLAESKFRSSMLVASTMMIAAVFMIWADKKFAAQKKHTQLDKVSNKQALGMGLAQALAIIPGISRSGATITSGLFLGMDRVAATRFSFLLGIPITAGAILKVMLSSGVMSEIKKEADLFAVGIATAFVSGILAIRFLLSYLSRHGLSLFAYYRIALGCVVILLTVIS